MKLYRNTYAEIDLEAYRHNIRAMSENASGVVAVVKADAYGHGAVEISRAAAEAGADALAVALPEEAIELRQAGLKLPIIVLGRANDAQARLSVELSLEQCVFTAEDMLRAQSLAEELGRRASVHLKIDTGMSRIGIREERELDGFIEAAAKCPQVDICGMFTHFACADEADKSFTKRQYEDFLGFAQKLRGAGYDPKLHAANSASCIDTPDYKLDYTRCGIASYGYYPSAEVDRAAMELRPVMRVFAEISQVKHVEALTPIGYNSTYKTQNAADIATVQIGYGDGYNRLLSNRGRMLVQTADGYEYAPIVGRVCMDQTMIDVTGMEGVREGGSVMVLGGAGDKCVSADELAGLCGTISYEILLSFSARVPRIYK